MMTEAERVRQMHTDQLADISGRLADIAAMVRGAQDFLDSAVEDARKARLSWGHIGSAVGMSRQGARQRWG